MSPVLRVRHYRSPHPDRWIVAVLFILALVAVALAVLG